MASPIRVFPGENKQLTKLNSNMTQYGLYYMVIYVCLCFPWTVSNFSISQIEEEFRRITLKPLKTTFLQKLDQHTPKLLSLFRSKGGAVGKKLGETLEVLNKASTFSAVGPKLISQ